MRPNGAGYPLPATLQASRPDAPGAQVRLLFFGIVRPYKGLDVLLRALAGAAGTRHADRRGGVLGRHRAERGS